LVPTIGLAFLAGFLSFISPCVLPLVPAYIGYMGGRLTHTVSAQVAVGAGGGQVPMGTPISQRFMIVLHTLAFVAGFTFIFVVLGLLTTAFILQIGRQNIALVEGLIARIGGLMVIFFGLHFMGVLPALFDRLLNHKPVIADMRVKVIVASVVGTFILWAFQNPTISLPILAIFLTLVFMDGRPLNALFSLIMAIGGALIIAWAFVDALLAIPMAGIFLMWMFLGGAFTTPEAFWSKTIGSIQRALYSEVRMKMTARGQQSFASSALMGVVFAAGWTPCIGPTLGMVMTMAANGGDVGQAGSLLGAYSLGLGVPFLVTAVMLDSVQGAMRRIQRKMHLIEIVTGALLVFIGVLISTGRLQAMSSTFARQFTNISGQIETCGIALAQGDITVSQLGTCLNDPTFVPGTSTASGNNVTGSQTANGITYGTEPGNAALDFRVVTADGDEMLLSDLNGKVVLVNFWATWCGPCRIEMPQFEAVYQRHADDGLMVVAVNDQEPAEDVLDFLEEISLSFPVALDVSGDIQRLYGVSGYPTTLVIDRDGIILDRHLGPMLSDQIEALVRDALT
jgi:cytochrome c-type biogenesis protein